MLSIVAVDDACESCWPLALAQQVLDPPDPIALSVAEGRDVKFHVGDENLDELRALEHLDGSSTEALSFSSVRLVAQGLRAVQVGIDGGSAGAAELHLVPGAPHSLQIQPPKGGLPLLISFHPLPVLFVSPAVNRFPRIVQERSTASFC